MNSRFGQLLVFVVVLVLLNVVAQALGLQVRISIIGSIVLTLIVGGIMALASPKN
jgi:NADH:ubiquinone oxidoreductase subunit 2 (subunit N)